MIAAGIGVLTGLISSLPSPLPDLKLDEPEILVSAERVPLHAGIAFGVGVALIVWLWASRDPGKCLLAMVLTLIGWLAAVNTANDVLTPDRELGAVRHRAGRQGEPGDARMGSRRSGGGRGGRWAHRLRGRDCRRERQADRGLGPVAAAGALFGLLLYPAVTNETIALLLVPWQAAVAAALANALTLQRT